MNYRHVFHAGNFADLVKHAILTRLLRDLTANPAPLTVIDTHAGAGLYDLRTESARRTGEGEAGVGRLMADPAAPAVFDDLKAAVRRANAPGEVRWYPGSPVLIAGALRPRDRFIACEARPDDHAALKQGLPRELGAVAHAGDGWSHAAKVAPRAPAALLVLIDPPFERGDDMAQAVALTRRLLAANPAAVIALWLPLKDLTSFDAAVGDMDDASGDRGLLVVETRLRPPRDPMRLNGCGLIVVNPTPGLEGHSRAVTAWVAGMLGEAGASGRAERLARGG
jgi:23S rRNA (adenine2030-N6)-methyltransferase